MNVRVRDATAASVVSWRWYFSLLCGVYCSESYDAELIKKIARTGNSFPQTRNSERCVEHEVLALRSLGQTGTHAHSNIATVALFGFVCGKKQALGGKQFWLVYARESGLRPGEMFCRVRGGQVRAVWSGRKDHFNPCTPPRRARSSSRYTPSNSTHRQRQCRFSPICRFLLRKHLAQSPGTYCAFATPFSTFPAIFRPILPTACDWRALLCRRLNKWVRPRSLLPSTCPPLPLGGARVQHSELDHPMSIF